MKKAFVIAAVIVSVLSANAEAAVVGTGYAPATARTAVQGKLLARRAAMVDCYKKLGGKAGMKVLKENWDGHTYTVEAE